MWGYSKDTTVYRFGDTVLYSMPWKLFLVFGLLARCTMVFGQVVIPPGAVVAGDPDAGRSSAFVTFTIEDGCDDEDSVEYRFFQYYDADSSETTRIWPERDEYYYYTESYGKKYTSNLNCDAGQLVCYGARVVGYGSYGVGFNGLVGCEDCCLTCPASGEVGSSFKLVCS